MTLSQQAAEYWLLSSVLRRPQYYAGHLHQSRQDMLKLLDSPYPQIKQRAGMTLETTVGAMR